MIAHAMPRIVPASRRPSVEIGPRASFRPQFPPLYLRTDQGRPQGGCHGAGDADVTGRLNRAIGRRRIQSCVGRAPICRFRAEIHIHAVEHALHVPVDVLNRARHEVSRIYALSGVEIVWDDAIGATDSTDLRARRLFLVIVPANRASGMAAVNGSAMGAAVKSSDGHGRLAYIFYNRVEKVAANADLALVLGHAMAHEIGHLLLAPGHAATGLMRADWTKDDFNQAKRGWLLFTADQAAVLQRAATRRR